MGKKSPCGGNNSAYVSRTGEVEKENSLFKLRGLQIEDWDVEKEKREPVVRPSRKLSGWTRK